MTDNEKYGVPEGYEFVRLDVPEVGEDCINGFGTIEKCAHKSKPYHVCVIVKPTGPESIWVEWPIEFIHGYARVRCPNGNTMSILCTMESKRFGGFVFPNGLIDFVTWIHGPSRMYQIIGDSSFAEEKPIFADAVRMLREGV